MGNKRYWVWSWIGLGAITLAFVVINSQKIEPSSPEPPAQNLPTPVTDNPLIPASQVVFPVDDFLNRITKKPFGIYITPETSPVQPEKFTGYHTGVDVEYGDVDGEVPVRAMADGKVVAARTASGYGGVLVIDHRPKRLFYSLSGHLDPESLPAIGTEVKVGDVVGKLAPAFSAGSGGERKHLHFAIIVQSTINIAGYVATEKALVGWVDPVKLLTQK